MSSAKFTVVIATYNANKTLRACLDSIATQTYRNFEVLIADGVSTDGTLETICSYGTLITQLVSEKDRGIYDAWNKVVSKATGDWVIFLGADDAFWGVETLSRAAEALSSVRENIAYGKVAIVLPDESILNFEGEPWNLVGKKFRHEMTIPHQGTFHRRELFLKYGLFDPSFKICGDYEFLLRELKEHPAFFIPDLIVSKMAFGGVSGTLGNVRTIIDELVRAQKMNGYTSVSPYIVFRRVRFSLRMGLNRVFGKALTDQIADLYRRSVGKPRLWGRFRD